MAGARPSIAIMAIHLDTTACFFHYTTREAAFGDIVPRKRLRFSAYERMRDPMENKQWTFPAAWFVKDDEPIESREQAYFEFHHLAAEIFKLAHLLALTVDAPYPRPDEEFGRGWSRARMWEQYAEEHRGVCLVFDQDLLTKNVSADLHRQLNVRPYDDPVEYTPRGGGGLTLDLGQIPIPVPSDYVRKYIEDNRYDLFFQKTLDWETEHEYRFVTTAQPDEPLYADYGDALVGIIVGEKFPAWERASAIESARQVGLEPQIMHWENNHPLPAALELETTPAKEESPPDRPPIPPPS
jgi:hypothetical protein